MIIAFTTWTWRPNSTSKEAYGWSYWFCPFGRSRVIFVCEFMQTRFISDAFIFILGRTCQILFSWRSHFRWTVGLFDWLPDFLFFWTCSSDPKYFSNEPKPKSFQKFHTICLRILFFRPNYVNFPPLFLTWTAVLQKWRMMKLKKIRTGSYK